MLQERLKPASATRDRCPSVPVWRAVFVTSPCTQTHLVRLMSPGPFQEWPAGPLAQLVSLPFVETGFPPCGAGLLGDVCLGIVPGASCEAGGTPTPAAFLAAARRGQPVRRDGAPQGRLPWARGFLELCPGLFRWQSWAWSQAGLRVPLRAFSPLPPLQNLPPKGAAVFTVPSTSSALWARLGVWSYMAAGVIRSRRVLVPPGHGGVGGCWTRGLLLLHLALWVRGEEPFQVLGTFLLRREPRLVCCRLCPGRLRGGRSVLHRILHHRHLVSAGPAAASLPAPVLPSAAFRGPQQGAQRGLLASSRLVGPHVPAPRGRHVTQTGDGWT